MCTVRPSLLLFHSFSQLARISLSISSFSEAVRWTQMNFRGQAWRLLSTLSRVWVVGLWAVLIWSPHGSSCLSFATWFWFCGFAYSFKFREEVVGGRKSFSVYMTCIICLIYALWHCLPPLAAVLWGTFRDHKEIMEYEGQTCWISCRSYKQCSDCGQLDNKVKAVKWRNLNLKQDLWYSLL